MILGWVFPSYAPLCYVLSVIGSLTCFVCSAGLFRVGYIFVILFPCMPPSLSVFFGVLGFFGEGVLWLCWRLGVLFDLQCTAVSGAVASVIQNVITRVMYFYLVYLNCNLLVSALSTLCQSVAYEIRKYYLKRNSQAGVEFRDQKPDHLVGGCPRLRIDQLVTVQASYEF
ncbi:hypothetical protein Ancab_017178 [Ancistrocladus abbreviatus]